MPAVSACPDRQVFLHFLQGKLSVPEVQQLEEHLGQCETCRDVLQQSASQQPPRAQGAAGSAIERVLSRFCTAASPQESTQADVPQAREDSAMEATAADLPRSRAADAGNTDFSVSGTDNTHVSSDATSDAIPVSKPSAAHQRTEFSSERLRPKSGELDDLSFLSPPQSPGEIGRLGKYIIVHVLGKGGMGMVFKCLDPHLQRTVALKVMLPSLAKEDSARQRFLREARATAAIKNDHVITIYDVGEDNGVPFLAMEFLEGEPLDQWMKPGRVPQVPEILRIGKEIARGLAAAHDRGLIHRDIKPGNIWLEAPHGRIKILDFGLARTVTEDLHLTKTGLIVGTPAYMAPEQAGGEPLDHRCDLFSLGCVMYRLCVGELPFTGTSTIAILKALALKEPRPIRETNAGIPQPLADAINRLLAKKPADRPANAHVVVDMLEAIERNLSMFGGPGQTSRTAVLPVQPAPAPVDPQRTEQMARERPGAPLPPPPQPLKRPMPSPSTGRHRSERRSSLSLGTVVLALLLLSGAAGGGYYLYDKIRTSKGTLEIVTEDPKVEVQVLQNGEMVTFINPEKQSVVELPAGEYEVRVGKNGRGYKTDVDSFTARHDQKAVVHVGKGFASDSSWVKKTAALPPDKQADAVAEKLKENNPGFDGTLDKVVDSNTVVGVTLRTDKVQDISPLKAFDKLKNVGFMGTGGQVEDLSPLKGLKLESLDCGDNKIKDLTPLEGMPLTFLLLHENPVKALSPLKDLPLVSLGIRSLDKVTDAEVLRSIKTLKTINGKPAGDVLKQLEKKAAAKKK